MELEMIYLQFSLIFSKFHYLGLQTNLMEHNC